MINLILVRDGTLLPVNCNICGEAFKTVWDRATFNDQGMLEYFGKIPWHMYPDGQQDYDCGGAWKEQLLDRETPQERLV